MRVRDVHLTASARIGTRRRKAAMSASAKPSGWRVQPVRIDAVHLADPALSGDAMHEGEVIDMAFPLRSSSWGKSIGSPSADPAPQFLRSAGEKMKEHAPLPARGGLAVGRSAIFDHRVLGDAVAAPAKGAALVHRMERVHDGQPARHVQPRFRHPRQNPCSRSGSLAPARPCSTSQAAMASMSDCCMGSSCAGGGALVVTPISAGSEGQAGRGTSTEPGRWARIVCLTWKITWRRNTR